MMSPSIFLSIIVLLIVEKSSICSLAIKKTHFDCFPRESKALLSFKESILVDNIRRYSDLSTWKNDSNCCTWQGVVCDNATGHVVKLDLRAAIVWCNMIDSSLLELEYLSYLDLSGNNFNNNSIPAFLGSIKQLQYLNLSNTNINGIVPHQLGNLSSLRTLDLSSSSLEVDNFMWVGKLSSLEYLNMSGVHVSTIKDVYKVLNMLPFLVDLRLSGSNIDNTNLPHTHCVNSTLLFTNLQHIDLSLNSFQGEIPCFLHNMTSMRYLDLSSNFFNETVDWISDKCHLKVLNLGGNQFHGNIIGAFKNLSLCASHELESLVLAKNKFDGHFPKELGELKQLTELDISNNKLSGPIPSSVGNLRALRSLDLSNNQLGGQIPISLGQLSNLELIDISSNSLEGTLSEAHFANLSKLEQLIVGTNNMSKFRIRDDWVPPFHKLKHLEMRSVEIGGQFPQWLQTQKSLKYLYLRNCSIMGTLPTWLGSLMNLTELHLPNNHIEGSIPELPSRLIDVDLSDNMITYPFPSNIGQMIPFLYSFKLSRNLISGPIPDSLSQMQRLQTLDLSNNILNGTIPESLCQMRNLRFLYLSKNLLSGNLAPCLGDLPTLYYVTLSSNQLSGTIPNSLGRADCSLEWLQLNNNSLTGQLPSSLKNCTMLSVLDVGDNKLSGKLPQWIGNHLLSLVILRVRNNKFCGDIPSTYCQLSRLQMMDIAHNQLTGSIQHCVGNFSSMVKGGSFSARIAMILDVTLSEVLKGVMREYTGSISKYLVNLDLSNNHLIGEIPAELTNLTGLIGLNLAHNHLTGSIPRNIGDMSSLESLDLSNNNLSGTISGSLSKLTSLSHLNLSNNNLSGPIPTGPQLQTFNNPSSYDGNPRLCGAPLPQKCLDNTSSYYETTLPRKVQNVDKVYLYAFITCGLATGFWGYFGVLVFKRSWRLALFGHMDALIGKLLGR